MIIREINAATHEGGDKTNNKIKQVFTWKGITWTVREFTKTCPVRQQHKNEHLAPKGLLSPLSIPKQIWEDISMDLIE